MNLAMLLLGPESLRQSRRYIAALGILLCLAGLAVALDASDTVTLITLEALGWIMVVFGLAKMAVVALTGNVGLGSLVGFRGVVYVVLGFAIADFPQESESFVPWMFSAALALNGLYQTASALVIRYPNWGWFLSFGLGNLVFSGLLIFESKQAITWVIPFSLGAGLALMGLTTLQTALRLSRYRRKKHADAESAVRYFVGFHVAGRFRRQYLAADPVAPAETGQAHEDLLVHIWTPVGVAKVERSPNLLNRFVMTRDDDGKYTVGHSALEMNPDVYISHSDNDPAAFEMANDAVLDTLKSKAGPGVFYPSFKEELAHYIQPTVTIRFRNFNEGQLRTFWAMYRKVTDYDLTNRNCSVAVALALESALMGSLGARGRFRTLLYLLTNRDLWVAHLIRWKAGQMVWTPGLVLEYVTALHRVVEG